MFFIFFCIVASKRIRIDVRKIEKKIGGELKKAGKDIEKEAKRTFEKLGPKLDKLTIKIKKLIHHRDDSIYVDPIEVEEIEKENLSDIFTADDLESIVEPLSYEFGIDSDKVSSFFNEVSSTDGGKREFHTFNISVGDDPKYRQAKMGTTLLKVVKNGNTYSAHVNKVSGTASLIASSETKENQKSESEIRKLDSEEVDDIYQTIKENISSEIDDLKKRF